MIFDKPILFLEINKNNIIIFSGKYNENFDFEILFKDIFNLSNFKLEFLIIQKNFLKILKMQFFQQKKNKFYFLKI